MAETANCTTGIGKSINNCFGIKNGNTAPCQKQQGNMCVYNSREESYEAFKTIWLKWYKTFPDYEMAYKWTGGDNTQHWLRIVTEYY